MATAAKTMEQVFIKEATGPNPRGWYEVEVAEYDEPLVTKEEKLFKEALASVGTVVEVEMGVKQNGDFTNRYLNKLQALEGEQPIPTPEQAEARTAPTKTQQRDETQKRIAAQWALGRAVEIHVANGGTVDDLLDTETFNGLYAAAEILLAGSQKLAEKA